MAKPKNFIFFVLAIFLFFLSVSFAFASTVTLSWDVNTEPDLAGYKIYYGISPRTSDCPTGGYSDKIDVGRTSRPEKPSYKIENLADGKTYYFSITSYDFSGNESCFSTEMSKTLPGTKLIWPQLISQFFDRIIKTMAGFFGKLF